LCKRSIFTQIKFKTFDGNTVKWNIKIYRTVWRVPYSNRKIIETDCGEGLCVRCLAPLSTTFHLYRGGPVLLVEETGISGENHRPASSHWQKLCRKFFEPYWIWMWCGWIYTSIKSYKIVYNNPLYFQYILDSSNLHGSDCIVYNGRIHTYDGRK